MAIEGKPISELPEAAGFEPGDALVMQRAGKAMQVPEAVMVAALTAAADGHGGIRGIVPTGSAGLVDTYEIRFADGTVTSFSVTNGAKGDQGDKGDKGDPGDPARLLGQTTSYGVSESGTEPPDSWASAPPAATGGQYLWTRIRLSFNGGDADCFVVSRMGIDGAGSVSSVNGKAPDRAGNVALTAEDIAFGDGSTVQAALDGSQKKIEVTGLLKKTAADGNVEAAIPGTDYANAPREVEITLAAKDSTTIAAGSEYNYARARWRITDASIKKTDHIIVAPAPKSRSLWASAEFWLDDMDKDGQLVFYCKNADKPDNNITVRLLVMGGAGA